MNPDEIKRAIESAAVKYSLDRLLAVDHLSSKLLGSADESIVEGVILVIEDTANRFEIQDTAVKTLKELNPRSAKNINSVINRIVRNWDLSCEEIIFWLADNYSRKAVIKSLETLKVDYTEEPELNRMKTMKWWLKA